MHFKKLIHKGDFVLLRVSGVNGCIDFPLNILEVDLSNIGLSEEELFYVDNMYISNEEYTTKTIYPSVNSLNCDILVLVNNTLKNKFK